jgi:hypothetical protein
VICLRPGGSRHLYLARKNRTSTVMIGFKAIFDVASTLLALGEWTPQATRPQVMTSTCPAIAAGGDVFYLAWGRPSSART